ncbi:Hint domain-containing protein [Acidisoma cellulosilytica]|uniref:Hint domain-containing protein n=1 Tax=Acidisoma cellulosilyticum TaxID=2802395 RepID=A0A963Z3Y8_9PROT|nr:Hint domain-containing protein [Acidisoma cellulosilyticum]MCB8881487.1 Hint domain-containing protein [Acidisoma cellulosilyticum]
MATRVWSATAGSTSWYTRLDWSGEQVPGAGDTVIIGPTSTGNYPILKSSTKIQGITINAGGSLTIVGGRFYTVALTVSGDGVKGADVVNAGTINLEGKSATILAALIVNGRGGIANSGTITATVGSSLDVGAHHAIANSGIIDVKSGKLTVTGLITDTGASQINISSGATLTTAEAITNTAGTITLAGGSLSTGTAALTLTSGSLTGYGSVTTGNFTGAGILKASGGLLTVDGTIDATGSATVLEIASGSTLDLAGNVGYSGHILPTLTFLSSVNAIFEDTTVTQSDVNLGTISGFAGSDEIKLEGSRRGTDRIVVSGDTLSIKSATGSLLQTYTFASGTDMSAIRLTTGRGVDTITICFMAGTLVGTPDGAAAIETLRPGDLVLTSDGIAKPVNWIGVQTISTRFADPLRNLPIRVKAGAIAENLPARDLLISPDHALLVNGVLICAGALVNGSSIVREADVPPIFVYYHIELDDHSLILAENVPAETFVDNVDRRNFDNWAEFEALYPEGKNVQELLYPRANSHRQVPVSIRTALADRALAIGTAVSAVA